MVLKNGKDLEETKMTDEFLAQKKAFEDYQTTLAQLVYRLETVLQPDERVLHSSDQPIQNPSGEEPLELLGKTLKDYAKRIAIVDKKRNWLETAVQTVKKMAAKTTAASNYRRSMQKVHREVIRHMRKFRAIIFPDYRDRWQHFEEAREKMDLERHEVKGAKTTLEIEKRAVHYKEAVEDFDVACTGYIKLVEELPVYQKTHAKDLLGWFQCHRSYHKKMATIW